MISVDSQLKNCLTSIKEIETTLNALADQAEGQTAKQAYKKAEQMLKEIKDEITIQVSFLSEENPPYE